MKKYKGRLKKDGRREKTRGIKGGVSCTGGK